MASFAAQSSSSTTVDLNIYQLSPPATSRFQSFLSSTIASAGYGTYHTSLTVGTSCYTFGAGSGISRSTSSSIDANLPDGCTLVSTTPLGVTRLSPGDLTAILNRLRSFFTELSYHLMYRNCNHFTETFATALIDYDQLPSESYGKTLSTYPSHVNRLAKASTALKFGEDYENKYARVYEEAFNAANAANRAGWDIPQASSAKPTVKGGKKKKELTEEQKKALANLKKK